MVLSGRLIVAVSLALLAVLAEAGSADGQVMRRFETDTVAIETRGGASHRFTVELATTSDERSRGLMYRRELASDHGMLFIYPRPREVSMWMKNTYLPLDMLFLDAAGRVVRIAERTTPLSREVISSGERVLAVLEVPGGTAERLDLARGDRVRHPVFRDGG